MGNACSDADKTRKCRCCSVCYDPRCKQIKLSSRQRCTAVHVCMLQSEKYNHTPFTSHFTSCQPTGVNAAPGHKSSMVMHCVTPTHTQRTQGNTHKLKNQLPASLTGPQVQVQAAGLRLHAFASTDRHTIITNSSTAVALQPLPTALPLRPAALQMQPTAPQHTSYHCSAVAAAGSTAAAPSSTTDATNSSATHQLPLKGCRRRRQHCRCAQQYYSGMLPCFFHGRWMFLRFSSRSSRIRR